MVSHPETGSDSPIGSDRDWGCDIIPTSIKCYKIHIISHIECVFALYSD